MLVARLHLQGCEEKPLQAAHEVWTMLMAPSQGQGLVKGAPLQQTAEQAGEHRLGLGDGVQAGRERGGACGREDDVKHKGSQGTWRHTTADLIA